jgi:hypothetical protein
MKKFKVYSSFITYLSTEVEAESLDDAWKQAQELDGGSFKQDDVDSWNIDDVYEAI